MIKVFKAGDITSIFPISGSRKEGRRLQSAKESL